MKKTGKVLGCLLPTVAGYGCQLAVVLLSSVIYSTIVTVQVLIAGIMDEAEFLKEMRKSYEHKFAAKPEMIDGNMKALEIALQEVK